MRRDINMNRELIWHSSQECPGKYKGNCDEPHFVVELMNGAKSLAYYLDEDDGNFQFYNDLGFRLAGIVKRWIELPE